MIGLDEAARFAKGLYQEVAGYDLSHEDRERLQNEDRSFTYGEVSPEAYADLLSRMEIRPGQVFCDLGTGTGKAVFLAAMLHDFSHLIGVELLPSLVAASHQVQARYDAEIRPRLPPAQQQQRIELREGDFLQTDLSGADLVFAHGTCFQAPLLEALEKKLVAELRPGAGLISLGMPYEHPSLRPFHFVPECVMQYGSSPAILYRKV